MAINYDDLREEQVESHNIFDGQVLHVFKDDITLQNGMPATREVIRHIGAVGIIPVTELVQMVMDGIITDGKIQVAVLKAAKILGL